MRPGSLRSERKIEQQPGAEMEEGVGEGRFEEASLPIKAGIRIGRVRRLHPRRTVHPRHQYVALEALLH